MSIETPKVSILVPIYNVEKYLERCAIGLFEQTYENIEYVFVNDCTPDGSIQVLEQLMKRYPSREKSTRIINHTVNRGLAAARNTAVENCTGEFIIHVDSDDYVELNLVKTLVNQQLSSKADIVTGMGVMHMLNGNKLLPNPHYNSKEEFVTDMMQLTINHVIWKRLIRRSLYVNHDVRAKEGVNCGEDCWVMTQLAYYASSFSFVDEVLYHYDCTREDSYMANKEGVINKKRLRDDIATANLIIDFFKDKEQVFFDEANRVAITFINLIMRKAASAGDKGFYQELLALLNGYDKRFWPAIDWDKSYRRILSQNFHSLKADVFYRDKFLIRLRQAQPLKSIQIRIMGIINKIARVRRKNT